MASTVDAAEIVEIVIEGLLAQKRTKHGEISIQIRNIYPAEHHRARYFVTYLFGNKLERETIHRMGITRNGAHQRDRPHVSTLQTSWG